VNETRTRDPIDTATTHADSVRAAFDHTGLAARYELLEEVGRGGMGVVYRGKHRWLDQPVAIKFHTPGAGVERFVREARLLAGVRSAHVVAVQDFDVLPTGQAMLVMNWVEGGDLGKLLRTGGPVPLPEERVAPWMLQVCEGMRAAAEQGIVHRDLKPSNILIDRGGQAFVADFGLARTAGVDPLTQSGGVMGTPLYMAPEQAENPRHVDTRADVYSFGATFYHALTGHPPFTGESWFAILFRHKTEPLASPRSRNPALSGRLNDCLERCLAKSPADRFQSFAEIATHLRPDGPAAPWEAINDSATAGLLDRYRDRRAVYLAGRAAALPDPDVYPFPNHRLLTVGFGNLAEQRVDALVSSDNGYLTMSTGVSAALARGAGDGFREAAYRFGPVRPGRAVVTPAGNLPARFVMHGVTVGHFEDVSEWVGPSRDLLNEIMESCFYHADTLGLRSIAFPLLGTGAGGFSPDVALDTMFRFLARKLARGLTTVREARIVLYEPGFG
jgi:O-acetyl-ADP-ribose deacetylase (regulator of RNase III)/predicted Ser/Thr protein kinase